MKYTKCKNYKYQLQEGQTFPLHFEFPDTEFKWASIKNNQILIKEGYAWDGVSGPTIDTKNSLVASLVHDAMYQLIRLKLLDYSYKSSVDKEFYKILREHKMCYLRARIWYLSVRIFGRKSATKIQGKEIVLECK